MGKKDSSQYLWFLTTDSVSIASCRAVAAAAAAAASLRSIASCKFSKEIMLETQVKNNKWR